MVDSARLLAMLEPMVRPAGLPAVGGGPGARVEKLPIEQRDFPSLLQEAAKSQGAAQDEAKAQGTSTKHLLAALGQPGAVENAAARKAQLGVMAEDAASDAGPANVA